MPMTPTWDRPWHETPNIHPCTIRDFFALCGTTAMWWRAGGPPTTRVDARRGGGFRGWPTCSASRGCFCCGVHATTGDAPAGLEGELDSMSNFYVRGILANTVTLAILLASLFIPLVRFRQLASVGLRGGV